MRDRTPHVAVRCRDLAVLAVVLTSALGLAAGRAAAATPRTFLTLPFASTQGMHVQRSWWTQNPTIFHHAIDYIRGALDAPMTWQRFRVIAAAPGEACAQVAGKRGCLDMPDERSTNRVLIRHDVDGTTYYTAYEDLRSIAPGIPLGSRSRTVHLERGAPVGETGEDPSLVHLHFMVLDAKLRPVDPYGIEGGRAAYPDPSDSTAGKAPSGSLWLSWPPGPPGSTAALAPTPRPRATSTPAPTPPSATPAPPSATPTPSPIPTGSPMTTAASPTDPGRSSGDGPLRTAAPLLVAGAVVALAAGLGRRAVSRRRAASGAQAADRR